MDRARIKTGKQQQHIAEASTRSGQAHHTINTWKQGAYQLTPRPLPQTGYTPFCIEDARLNGEGGKGTNKNGEADTTRISSRAAGTRRH
jgi:hypothetical protein